jgi:Ca-activated chloride channel family protein
MEGKKNILNLEARWDHDEVRVGKREQRGLLVDISAPNLETEEADRQPVNLSLVIDASGSMGRGKLDAAKAAAIGICEALGAGDCVSVVSFSNDMIVHVDGLAMDDGGRARAQEEISYLRTRGSTNLGRGWFEGAACAARVMEHDSFRSGNVLVLSDGKANRGITDPVELARHAADFARQGIITSSVGIGDRYSPVQLDAISEAGMGRTHDAADPEEIIEVVLGDLGEVRRTVATDVQVSAHVRGGKLRALSRYASESDGFTTTYCLGTIGAGGRRSIALLVETKRLINGNSCDVTLELSWTDASTGEVRTSGAHTLRLTPVEEWQFDETRRDKKAAERIALLWEASLGFRAMHRNERRDYAGAERLYADSAKAIHAFSRGLDCERQLNKRVARTRRRVAKQWDGRGKRESMVLAKKMMKSEADLRSIDKGDWFDHLSDLGTGRMWPWSIGRLNT